MSLCKFCNTERKNAGLKNHEQRCPSNPNRVIQHLTEAGLNRLKTATKNQNDSMWTLEMRAKHSAKMSQVVKDNPDSYSASNVCGRVKIHEFNGEKFHGAWELEVAKFLTINKIEYKRTIEPIPYKWNNKWHLYFPDFYLPKLGIFLEVKGYETERDRCKWSSLRNLVVLKQKEIGEIMNGGFDIGRLA